MSRDVLQQMLVTAANGEEILLYDLSYKALKEGNREELEARRIDTLMRLGVTKRQEGPIRVTGIEVSSIRGEAS